MTTDLTGIAEGPLLAHIVATLTLAVGLIGIRVRSGWLLGRLDAVKRRSRRRWLDRVRNATVLLVVIGFAAIWFDHQRRNTRSRRQSERTAYQEFCTKDQ